MDKDTHIILQARMSSTRLPGKVLKPFMGVPMLEFMLNRLPFENLIVATSDEESDNPIVELCEKLGRHWFRGSLNDVLDRYYWCAKLNGSKPKNTIVRITSDCPLIPKAEIERCIDYFQKNHYFYVYNRPGVPDGWDCEVFSFGVLEDAWNEAQDRYDREHVTPYMKRQDNSFVIPPPKLSIDTQEDFERVLKYV